jgi:hypothetical protein
LIVLGMANPRQDLVDEMFSGEFSKSIRLRQSLFLNKVGSIEKIDFENEMRKVTPCKKSLNIEVKGHWLGSTCIKVAKVAYNVNKMTTRYMTSLQLSSTYTTYI